MIVPVILAGGSGSRLWPVSRIAYPKQFLSLVTNHTMLQETVLRTQLIKDITAPFVICNQEHRFLVAAQLQEIGVNDATIILEPVGKNTCPAATIAALYHEKENPILLILPADHFIKDAAEFSAHIKKGIYYAESNKLVTFGIIPNRPETGYGYIKVLKKMNEAFTVESFVEKPDYDRAKEYINSGNYYWNSGILMFKAKQLINELREHAPNILSICIANMSHIKKDFDFFRLNKRMFAECPSESIDNAIMEKTKNSVLIPLNLYWNDIGSWSALCDAHEQDNNGNIVQGDIFVENVKNSYLRAESRMLAAIDVKDHIIVETPDAVLVMHKNSCQNIKNVVSYLKQMQRKEAELHRKVYRPWGNYEILYVGNFFQVKRITIKANSSLSLQMHCLRSEHWVVVKGTAQVTCGDKKFLLAQNESTFIPKTIKHRIDNPTQEDIEIIEIQLGSYLGEDDIVRFEDSYGRMEFQE